MYNNKQRRCLTPQLPSEQSSVNSLLPTIFLKPSLLLSSSAHSPTTQCFAHEKQQWNGIMWIITFPNKQYSFFPHCYCYWILLGRFGFSIEENIRARKKIHLTPHIFLFVCYYSILILFFLTLECLILWHYASTSHSVHFFFHSHSLRCHDMEWRKLYCYLFSRVSHIHSQKKKKREWRESERSENGMRSFVSVNEQENEADIKVWGEGWKTHFCVLSSTQYYLYTQRIAFSSSSNNDIKHP